MSSFRISYGPSQFALKPGEELVIGRSSSCDLRLHDKAISRIHAILRVEGGNVVVDDQDSRNGVYVNGRRARGATRVPVGAELRMGKQVIEILRDGRPLDASLDAHETGVGSTVLEPYEGNVRGDSPAAGGPGLSEREREVVSLLARGFTQKQIGDAMAISPKTVESYVRRIRDKIGTRKRSELVEYARFQGIISGGRET